MLVSWSVPRPSISNRSHAPQGDVARRTAAERIAGDHSVVDDLDGIRRDVDRAGHAEAPNTEVVVMPVKASWSRPVSSSKLSGEFPRRFAADRRRP